MKFAVCIAALVVLGGCSVDGNQRADQVGNTVVGQALARGKDEKCMENIRQVRMAIEMAKQADENSTLPPTLDGLKLPKEMLEDPIGHEPYQYDPAAGTVKCPHPGHAKY